VSHVWRNRAFSWPMGVAILISGTMIFEVNSTFVVGWSSDEVGVGVQNGIRASFQRQENVR
jgi:hypothetical protein